MGIINLKTEEYNITFKSEDRGFFWGDQPLKEGEYSVEMTFASGISPDEIKEEFESLGVYDVVVTPYPVHPIIY